jgi:hypothetical protein
MYLSLEEEVKEEEDKSANVCNFSHARHVLVH